MRPMGARGIKGFLVLITALGLILSACGTAKQPAADPGASAGSGSTPAPAPAPAPAPVTPVKLRIAHVNPPGVPFDVTLNAVANQLRQQTNGAIDITVHPAQQLGNLREIAEGVQTGTVDIAMVDSGTMAQWYPRLGYVSLPFMFRDLDHWYAVTRGDLGKQLAKEVEEKLGIKVLAWIGQGFRVMVTKEKPLKSAEDLKGMKFRVPEIELYVRTFQLLETAMVPLPWGDVYTSMQTGVIAGVEAPAAVLEQTKLQEIAKHVSTTYHIFGDVNVFINMKSFNKLSAEHQKLLVEAMDKAFDRAWHEKTFESEKESLAKMVAGGMTLTTPDRPSFQKKVQPMWQEWADKNKAQDIIDLVQKTGR